MDSRYLTNVSLESEHNMMRVEIEADRCRSVTLVANPPNEAAIVLNSTCFKIGFDAWLDES